jgi:hypothetical protein
LLRDEQFGFRPCHSTTLQLARLVERVNRNFDERRLSDAVFLYVAEAFDTVWVKGLLYKLAVLKFLSYLVKTVSSYLDCRTFRTSFQSATSACLGMWAGVAQGGLVTPGIFSLYVNDIPTPTRHVELAQYADDTALIATSRSPSLVVAYLEAYLGTLDRWVRDWRISINVLKCIALLIAGAERRIQKPRTVQFLREPIQWVETARYLGVTLVTQLTWSAHVNRVGKKAAYILGMHGPLLNRRISLSVRHGVLVYKQLTRPMMDFACPIWRSAARSHVRKLHVLQSKCLRLATNAPWYVSDRQVHEDLGIPFFAYHIKALTESFDSKLADARNPLFRQLGRHLCRPKG